MVKEIIKEKQYNTRWKLRITHYYKEIRSAESDNNEGTYKRLFFYFLSLEKDNRLSQAKIIKISCGVYGTCKSQMYDDNKGTLNRRRGLQINCCKILT